LENCPPDIKQRIADGMCSPLSALTDTCGSFNYAAMLASNDPTSHLPVLFSSESSRSSRLVPTNMNAPTLSGIQVCYWIGLPPTVGASLDTVCYRISNRESSSTTYGFYDSKLGWVECDMFASCSPLGFKRVGVKIHEGHVMTYPNNILKLDIVGGQVVVTDLVLSGNGNAIFINTNEGWKRHVSEKSWETLGMFGKHLSTSFDGSAVCVHDFAGDSKVFCKLGSQGIFETSLPPDPFTAKVLHSAVLGSMVFLVRGANVYTVGSLKTPTWLTRLSSVGEGEFAGVWADHTTVWVSGLTTSYMTTDAGWTWTPLFNSWAVGPGVFYGNVRASNRSIELASEPSFEEQEHFPLTLHDNGALIGPSGSEHWFRLKESPKDKFTQIETTETMALSPNGLFLYTRNPQGGVKLCLNVWNTPEFARWCAKNAGCNKDRSRYCTKFISIDRRCKKPGLPVWAIVLITLAALVLVGLLLRTGKSVHTRYKSWYQ
jgi:hypothetical protein